MTALGPQGRFLLGGALGLALYAVAPDGNVRTALFVAIGFSAVAAILFGIRINKPALRKPWSWFAAGLAANVTGKVVESLLIWREVSSWPSVADAFYLALYPCVVFGPSSCSPGPAVTAPP